MKAAKRRPRSGQDFPPRWCIVNPDAAARARCSRSIDREFAGAELIAAAKASQNA